MSLTTTRRSLFPVTVLLALVLGGCRGPQRPAQTAPPQLESSTRAASQSGAAELVRAGEEHLSRNEVVKAAECAYQARKADERFIPAYLLLAASYARAGEPQKVRQAFQDALKVREGEVEVRMAWARFELEQSRPLDALPQSQRATELAGENPLAWTIDGRVRQVLGDREGARKSFGEALRLNPNEGEAHAVLGEMELDADHLEPALRHFQAAYQAGERGVRVGSFLALALLAVGEDAASVSEAERVLNEIGRPANPPSLIAQGMLLEHKGDLKAAVEMYRMVLSRNPYHDRAQYALAQALRSMRDPGAPAAMARYNQLLRTRQELIRVQDQLRREGRTPRLLRLEGETLLAAGRPADAARVFSEWVAKEPRSSAAKAALQRALKAGGRP